MLQYLFGTMRMCTLTSCLNIMRFFDVLAQWFSSAGLNRRMASNKKFKRPMAADLSIILELLRLNFSSMHASNSRIIFDVEVKLKHRFDMLKVFAVYDVIENFRFILLRVFL